MRARWAKESAEDWVKLRDRGMTADWQVFQVSELCRTTAGTSCKPLTKAVRGDGACTEFGI
jgi:hypothetical protein